jgi:hypothetical protein
MRSLAYYQPRYSPFRVCSDIDPNFGMGRLSSNHVIGLPNCPSILRIVVSAWITERSGPFRQLIRVCCSTIGSINPTIFKPVVLPLIRAASDHCSVTGLMRSLAYYQPRYSAFRLCSDIDPNFGMGRLSSSQVNGFIQCPSILPTIVPA